MFLLIRNIKIKYHREKRDKKTEMRGEYTLIDLVLNNCVSKLIIISLLTR